MTKYTNGQDAVHVSTTLKYLSQMHDKAAIVLEQAVIANNYASYSYERYILPRKVNKGMLDSE